MFYTGVKLSFFNFSFYTDTQTAYETKAYKMLLILVSIECIIEKRRENFQENRSAVPPAALILCDGIFV